jgi:hypothetical protein
MKRIQNGELVELSAAGKKLDQNSDVAGLFGMVVKYRLDNRHCYQIAWYRADGTTKKFPMARYEIKRFKGAK